MSLYIRKNLNVGPYCFNLSKTGISVSNRIPAFGTGNELRGNYIYVGRNGLFYTSASRSDTNQILTEVNPASLASPFQLESMQSANVLKLQNSSAAEIQKEINEKIKRPSYWIFAGLFSLFSLCALGISRSAWIFVVGLICLTGFIVFTYLHDQVAKTTVLFYTVDGEVENAYLSLCEAFRQLQSCKRTWFVNTQTRIFDPYKRKTQAGASSLVNRTSVALTFDAPNLVSTNIAIPRIPAGNQTLYFFPDQVLVRKQNTYQFVAYSEIQMSTGSSRFIETDSLPKDANVVDYTWRYANKNGSPDGRFKNNYRIPIALYSELEIVGLDSLNHTVQFSKPNQGSEFIASLKRLEAAIEHSSTQKIPKGDPVYSTAKENNTPQSHRPTRHHKQQQRILGLSLLQLSVLVFIGCLAIVLIGAGAILIFAR